MRPLQLRVAPASLVYISLLFGKEATSASARVSKMQRPSLQARPSLRGGAEGRRGRGVPANRTAANVASLPIDDGDGVKATAQ
eukprot:7302819-Pyramimonas_sp.AAC.1